MIYGKKSFTHTGSFYAIGFIAILSCAVQWGLA